MTHIFTYSFIDFIANVTSYLFAIYLIVLFAYRNFPIIDLMHMLMPVAKVYRVNETENMGISKLKAQLKNLVSEK